MTRTIRPTKAKQRRRSKDPADEPSSVLPSGWLYPTTAVPKALWSGLKPVRMATLEPNNVRRSHVQIVVDPGDSEVQHILEYAAINEADWTAGTGTDRRILRRGAKLIGILFQLLQWSAGPRHWRGQSRFASEARLRAQLLLEELIARLKTSIKSQKGHARAINRMIVAPQWTNERYELISQLRRAKAKLGDARNESQRSARANELAKDINQHFVAVFMNDCLRIRADDLLMMVPGERDRAASPTQLAQKILLDDRFIGVANRDDAPHANLRVGRRRRPKP